MKWLWKYIYQLRVDNDCRANTFLALVTMGFLFNLFVFGITPEPHGLSLTAQEAYSAAGIKIQTSWGIWDWLRWNHWRIWWICFLISIVYRFIAWHDELRRAWENTKRRFAEIRKGINDLTPGQPAPAGAEHYEHPTGLSAWLRVFVREFVAAITGDIIVGRR